MYNQPSAYLFFSFSVAPICLYISGARLFCCLYRFFFRDDYVLSSVQSLATKLPLYLAGQNDLICYLPGGIYWGSSGRVVSTDAEWVDARDLEICIRLHQRTECGVYSLTYDIRSSFDTGLLFYKPHKWINRVYDFAKTKGYTKVHLVGFSGGGSVASSQFLYYPDPIVRNLIIISGKTAHKPKAAHVNAAFYSDQITIPTLLIYGRTDGLRPDANEWIKNNLRAKLIEYEGGHDFQPMLKLVEDSIVQQIAPEVTPPPSAGRKIKLQITINGIPVTVRLTEGEKQTITADVVATIEE